MKTQTRKKDCKPKRGYGLVVVLGFAAVLAVFTAAIGAQASYSLGAVSRRGQTDQAYYGAYNTAHLAANCVSYVNEQLTSVRARAITQFICFDRRRRIEV